ncbi:MAG: recombinase RarA, partial [Desulfovibrio sp.]|nr:recombinase RarA [Desulfovibrio sp.]
MRIELSEKQPLADKIRPQTLDEFVGQSHLLERIAAFAQGPRLPSLLFFGPPGCGK